MWQTGVWIFYLVSNVMGTILSALVLLSVNKNADRTAGDVFVAGMAGGSVVLALTCSAQCIANLTGDGVACRGQALVYVGAMVTDFFCMTAISLSTHIQVVRKLEITTQTALRVVGAIWFICFCSSAVPGMNAPLLTDTACFFAFDSVPIIAWLIPSVFACLCVMTACHVSVLVHLMRHLSEPSAEIEVLTRGQILRQQVWWRSTMFSVLLLACWGGVVVITLYVLAGGSPGEETATAIGLGAVSFSWLMPVLYTWRSKPHQQFLRRLCCR